MKDLKVIFMGTPEFSVPVLEMLIENTNVQLVVTQPDKKQGRKQILTPPRVKEVAMKNHIPVFQPVKIREDVTPILETDCDIIITCAYGQIIPDSILTYPKLGCINVHASLLPKYRGGAPIHWCLINGDEKTGITIMYMDSKMDSGDIISQQEYEIQKEDNVLTLHQKLSLLGSSLLKETLPSIMNGTNNRTRQDEKDVTYAYNIRRSEERIDFSQKGRDIVNLIRGLNPWPLANVLVNQEEFKIIEAYFMEKEDTTPNKINSVSKDAIGIECIDGVVYVTKLKPFGKKEMLVKDYLNGVKKEDILNWKINEE